jgi:hypothetical protein
VRKAVSKVVSKRSIVFIRLKIGVLVESSAHCAPEKQGECCNTATKTSALAVFYTQSFAKPPFVWCNRPNFLN